MEEILMDILSRLPVKSLVRFKCVSKYWKTLISQSYFKKQHLNHAKNQLSSQKLLFIKLDPKCHFWSSSLSLVQLVKDTRIFDCPSNFNPKDGIKIYCSCDGLVLIGIWSDPHVEQPLILVIWNPSTRESIVLPSKFSLQMGHASSTSHDDEHMEEDSNNSDDDDYSIKEDDVGSTYGLAYDSISDDYKVFRINLFRSDHNEILALKNASWRIIDHQISGRTDCSMLTGGEDLAFVHGAFHWLGIVSRFCVVSFNISDEMYGEIPLPEIMCSCSLTLFKSKVEVEVDVGVSVLGGMLSFYYKDEFFFNLWIMKDHGLKDSWMKLFTIPISTGVYRIIPTYVFSNDQVLLRFDHHYWVKPEYLYRLISGGPFGLSDRMWPLDYDDIGTVTIDEDGCVYTESLISPKLGH